MNQESLVERMRISIAGEISRLINSESYEPGAVLIKATDLEAACVSLGIKVRRADGVITADFVPERLNYKTNVNGYVIETFTG